MSGVGVFSDSEPFDNVVESEMSGDEREGVAPPCKTQKCKETRFYFNHLQPATFD